MEEKIQLLKDRFIHRTDAYGKQWYEEGRGTGYAKQKISICKDDPCHDETCKHTGDKPLTDKTIQRHIEQKMTIGIYQLDEHSTLKWLCLDVDVAKQPNKDDTPLPELIADYRVKETTKALAKVFNQHNIPFLVEQSGSRGYHLWVFFSEPIEAKSAYALCQWTLQQVEPMAGISIEIFPKQVNLRNYGNLVKMPLSLHRKTMNPCFFVGSNWEPKNDQWETLENVKSVSKKNILHFLRVNKIEVLEPASPVQETTGAGTTTPPCYERMMREGVRDGHMDIGLFKLGCYMRDRGLTQDMAVAALQEMLMRDKAPAWSHTLVKEKVESAYSRKYAPLPCSEALLDSYCSSSCRFFIKKAEIRHVSLSKAVGNISRD